MRAIVTDVHLRNVVAGIRGLGQAGIDVVALGPRRRAAGWWSRHACARRKVPDVLVDAAGFVSAASDAAARFGPAPVYPGSEAALDALLAGWGDFPEDALLPYPGRGPVDALRDKAELTERAREAGFPALDTLFRGTADDLLKARVPLPCAVKAPHPSPSFVGTRLIATREELEKLATELDPNEELLVQPLTEGRKVSVNLVLDRDFAIAGAAMHETTRSWPAGAGSSALARSIALDADLLERVRRLLAEAGFWGLAEVEMLQTPAGLAPMDVNPRYYGTLHLTLASGVNLPAIWHAVVTGAAPPPPEPYREEITFRWLEADIVGMLQGKRDLLRDTGARPRVGAMWDGRDPLPGLLLSAEAVVTRVSHRLGR